MASRRCGTHSVNQFIGILLQLTEDDTKFLGKKQKGARMSKEDLGVCDSCVVLHVAVVDT